ncbi:hypothetical protein GTD56_004846 [Salmonella enterica subsp. diarizonae]|nr:hypothetical protein [Salmonella enterica subsp. diarizonae]
MLSREDFYMIKQMRQQGAYIVDIATHLGVDSAQIQCQVCPVCGCVFSLSLREFFNPGSCSYITSGFC